MEFSKDDFSAFIEGKRGSIKGALMDQSSIAGIGNMYADEIIFQCGIHPKTSTSKLSEKEADCLYEQMMEVLETVIKSKESDSGLPKDYLTGHRNEGDECPKSNGKIEMIKVSGRSTYFCPSCQQEKK